MFSDNPRPLGIETDRFEEIKSYYNKFKTQFPNYVFGHESINYYGFIESLPKYINAEYMSKAEYVAALSMLYTKLNFNYTSHNYIYKTNYELMDLMMTIMQRKILHETEWREMLRHVECFDFNDDYEDFTKKLLNILNLYFYEAHISLSNISYYIAYEFKEDGIFSEKYLIYEYLFSDEYLTYCERIKLSPAIIDCCKAIYNELKSFILKWPRCMPTLYARMPEFFDKFIVDKNKEMTKQNRSQNTNKNV